MVKIWKQKVGRNRSFHSKKRLLVESPKDLYRDWAIPVFINDLEKGRRWQEVTNLAPENKSFKATKTNSLQ